MDIKILGIAKDYRTNSSVIYAQMNINDYLNLLGDNFDDFTFQRKRTNYKPYERMKSDIIMGALLPTLTLAIKSDFVDKIKSIVSKEEHNISKESDLRELEQVLIDNKGNFIILDGLQRTYILQDLKKQEIKFEYNQKLLLEFWIESDVKNLIYRLIVLNAGQKKMSMRHQIELLFTNVRESLVRDLDIEIHIQKDSTRRDKPKKYAFDRIVMGYQSFLLKNTEITKSNVVAQEMLEDNILDSTAEKLGKEFETFKDLLLIYSRLDLATYNHYSKYNNDYKDSVDEYNIYEHTISKGWKNWFAEGNVISSFFAATAKYLDQNNDYKGLESLVNKLNFLISEIENAKIDDDPLALNALSELQKGMNTRKTSIDYQTRWMIHNGFLEYFRTGAVIFDLYWPGGAM